MRKFLTGFVSGMLVLFSGYLWADTTPQGTNSVTDYVVDPDLSHPWTGKLSVPKLLKDTPTTTANPNDAAQPVLSLTKADPLLEFSRADIKKVCLAFFGNKQETPSRDGFTVEIYLTPEARRTIGAQLKNRDGKAHSFRLVGSEISSFVADGVKAARFEKHADIYPHIDDIPPVTDFAGGEEQFDVAIEETRFDIGFHVPYSAAYAGLNYAKFASGTNDLETCDPDRSVKEAAGYGTHKKMWPAMLKHYAEMKDKGLLSEH